MCQMTLINPASLAADSPDNRMFCYIGLEAAVALDEGFYLFPWPVGKQRQPRPASEQPLPTCPSSPRGEPGSAGRAECRRKTRSRRVPLGGPAAMPPCRVSHRQPCARRDWGAEKPSAPMALLQERTETSPSLTQRDRSVLSRYSVKT